MRITVGTYSLTAWNELNLAWVLLHLSRIQRAA